MRDAYVALGLPLCAWGLILIATFLYRKRPGDAVHCWATTCGISGTGLALMAALTVLRAARAGFTATASFTWLAYGNHALQVSLGVDLVTAMMLVVVGTVSLLVQVYSVGYMHGDTHLPRYYANISLFTFAMFLLLLARDYLTALVGWELMGLCSFLLIGHYFTQQNAQRAAVKAFLTTRLGDVGLFFALMVLADRVGSFEFATVFAKVPQLGPGVAAAVALGLFAAAAGKSAQVPLSVWLPDAMAGPTPVSALIHAATMVAAGVYLVARSFPIFVAAPSVMRLVAYLGGLTAFLAGTMALTTHDLKRVLAFSTISQLGYMMLALGSGGRAAALFHLMTHAFFKAMLFLAAGAVIHAVHTQDMREMGGLFRRLPVTATVFLVGALALVGIPPFAGYFSKEEILAAVAAGGPVGLLPLALLTVALTGLYTTRAFYLTFLAPDAFSRATHGVRRGSVTGRLHVPAVMEAPLVVLALFTLLAGFVGGSWAARAAVEAAAASTVDTWVGMMALALAVGGVLCGWLLYTTPWGAALRRSTIVQAWFWPARHGYGLDAFWETIGLRFGAWSARTVAAFDRAFSAHTDTALVGLARACAAAVAWCDRRLIDPLGDGVAMLVRRLAGKVELSETVVGEDAVHVVSSAVERSGHGLRRLETGYVANYLFTFLLGLVFYLLVARMLA